MSTKTQTIWRGTKHQGFGEFPLDMEQYFDVAHISTNEQVTITTRYLLRNAKVSWYTKASFDAAIDRLIIEMC